MNEKTPNLTGKTITSTSGREYTLVRVAGYGAQGAVYEESSGLMMVKLYHPSGSDDVDKSLLERLDFIRGLRMPDNFVRVEDVIAEPYVGYAMRRVDDHKPLSRFLIPDKGTSFAEWYNSGRGLRDRLFIGYVIAKAFRDLERNNLSYCDISGSNILVKIGKSASVRIIDVDNIYVAGKGLASVFGTPRYIAPEVLSRERNPDVLSDNYSLAVILFELLRVGHPYISDDVMSGTPEDEDNALAGMLDYVTDDNSQNMLPASAVLTTRLRNLFEQCFVDGKANRLKRPSALDFELALLDASNKVIRCPTCGAWHYPRKAGRVYLGCPWCDSPSAPKARLNFYECLSEGKDFRTSAILSKRLTNTYILRDGKNRVKSLYLLGGTTRLEPYDPLDDCYTIAKNTEGYWAFNEFDKDRLLIVKHGTHKVIRLESHGYTPLKRGDRVIFGEPSETMIENKRYFLSVMAVFDEVQ